MGPKNAKSQLGLDAFPVPGIRESPIPVTKVKTSDQLWKWPPKNYQILRFLVKNLVKFSIFREKWDPKTHVGLI